MNAAGSETVSAAGSEQSSQQVSRSESPVYNTTFDEADFPDDAEGAEGASDKDAQIDDDIDESDADDDESEKKAAPFRDPPEGQVRMRPSSYNNIPSTVFIEYPPELKIRRTDTNVLEKLGKRQLCYTSHWERICIRNAFVRAGFEKTVKGPWTAMWSKHQNELQMQGLNCLQKVNHFPHSWCIGRKDRLVRTLQAMYRLHGQEFNFHPASFILPSEREAAHRQIAMDIKAAAQRGGTKDRSNAAGGLWIIKPVASSCGRGIQVISGSQVVALHKNKKLLVQKYIADPYLIEGNKFDLRMYVLVTGVDPMRVYIFKEGLTRISTSSYSLKNIDNKFAHLTNYSINKKSKDFKAASESFAGPSGDGKAAADDNCETEGFKWSLTAFKKWLAKKEGDAKAEEAFRKVDDLLVKTMISAESTITPQLHSNANYRSNCFELFGVDVLLDVKLQPHLIEVNISPSLAGSSPLDKRIKGTLIADIMHTLGIYPHDPKILKKFDELGAGASQARITKRSAGKTASSRPTSAGYLRVRSKGTELADANTNPFKFGSMSKMMAAQDAWRKSPTPENISFEGLGDNDAVWMMLLMTEDEFDRCASTQLIRKHPLKATAAHYNSLYFSSRFSDQLLARWVMEGGARGALGKHIPDRFLNAEMLLKRTEKQRQRLSVDPSRELGASGKLGRRWAMSNDTQKLDSPGSSEGRSSASSVRDHAGAQYGHGLHDDENQPTVQQRLLAMAESSCRGASERSPAFPYNDIEAGDADDEGAGGDPLESFGVAEIKLSEDGYSPHSAQGLDRPKNPTAFTPLTMAEAYDVVKNGLLRRGREARSGNSGISSKPRARAEALKAAAPNMGPWRDNVVDRPKNPIEHQSRASNHRNVVFQQRQMQQLTKWEGDDAGKFRSRSNPAVSRAQLKIEKGQGQSRSIMVRDASHGVVALPRPPASSKAILAEKQSGRKVSAPRMKM